MASKVMKGKVCPPSLGTRVPTVRTPNWSRPSPRRFCRDLRKSPHAHQQAGKEPPLWAGAAPRCSPGPSVARWSTRMPDGAPLGPSTGRSTRTRTRAVWRPHPPWPKQRQRSPPWCPCMGGRGRDERPSNPNPEAPRRTRTLPLPQGRRHAGCPPPYRPPPTPPPDAGQHPTHRPAQKGASDPEPGMGTKKPGHRPLS